MPENTRVKISSVVKNQLPEFIRADFPLAGEFLAQYYTSLEGQGSTLDVLQNIDKYIKVDELSDLIDSTNVSAPVGIADNVINVDSTTGFPNSYGLLEIGNEVVTYTGITTNSFTGCSRGFSGITSYRAPNEPEELVFTDTSATNHTSGSSVTNLSALFLKEFYKKLKSSLTPGLEDVDFVKNLDVGNFIKESKSLYQSKGTEESFRILFNILYGITPTIIDLLKQNFKISEICQSFKIK